MLLEQKRASAWRIMIKTWGEILLGGMSKNKPTQFFDSQMYLPAILALEISTTTVKYTGSGKNSIKIMER